MYSVSYKKLSLQHLLTSGGMIQRLSSQEATIGLASPTYLEYFASRTSEQCYIVTRQLHMISKLDYSSVRTNFGRFLLEMFSKNTKASLTCNIIKSYQALLAVQIQENRSHHIVFTRRMVYSCSQGDRQSVNNAYTEQKNWVY